MNCSNTEQPMTFNAFKERTSLHLVIVSIVPEKYLLMISEVMVIAIFKFGG